MALGEGLVNVVRGLRSGLNNYGDVARARAAFHEGVDAAVAALSSPQGGSEPADLPRPGSPEASAMIDSVLAEYGWPSNTKNAARAGFEAARRFAAAPPHGAEPAPLLREGAHVPVSVLPLVIEPLRSAAESLKAANDYDPETEFPTDVWSAINSIEDALRILDAWQRSSGVKTPADAAGETS